MRDVFATALAHALRHAGAGDPLRPSEAATRRWARAEALRCYRALQGGDRSALGPTVIYTRRGWGAPPTRSRARERERTARQVLEGRLTASNGVVGLGGTA